MEPTVSVLIDTYNHERYIEQCIVSTLEQSFPRSDYEIVVVDDGSTDRTPEIVRKFAPRVRLLQKTNGGQASAFNAGFRELHGSIIVPLDGDDWLAMDKLKASAEALERCPEAQAVAHGYYEFHEGSGELRPRIPDRLGFFHLGTPQAATDARNAWPFMVIGSLTLRRAMLDRVIPIGEALRFCADAPVAIGSLAGGTYLFAEPLSYYRHHSDNLHATDPKNTEKMRRRFRMNELAFEHVERMLLRLGVDRECIAAFLYPSWIPHSREGLTRFGTGRRKVFNTEIRAFQLEHREPTLAYRVFKYLSLGAATMALPPPLFYRAKEWYSRGNLGRLGRILARGR